MPSGRVKFFDEPKGYGFLVPDDGGPDVFVHMRQVRRAKLKPLVPGEALTFAVSSERGRPEAIDLERPSAALIAVPASLSDATAAPATKPARVVLRLPPHRSQREREARQDGA